MEQEWPACFSLIKLISSVCHLATAIDARIEQSIVSFSASCDLQSYDDFNLYSARIEID